jgi:uncharacterized damage-inducible protein DinB
VIQESVDPAEPDALASRKRSLSRKRARPLTSSLPIHCIQRKEKRRIAAVEPAHGPSPIAMDDQLLETWAIHNRINLYMLDAIPDDALGSSLPTKSRTVYDLFAHIHNVRLMWLKAAAPDLLKNIKKLETKTVAVKTELRKELEASGRAIESLLKQAMASGGKVKGFKPHAVAFLGYLISHESHHRGQAGWALKSSRRPLDQKTAFGLWEWGVR